MIQTLLSWHIYYSIIHKQFPNDTVCATATELQFLTSPERYSESFGVGMLNIVDTCLDGKGLIMMFLKFILPNFQSQHQNPKRNSDIFLSKVNQKGLFPLLLFLILLLCTKLNRLLTTSGKETEVIPTVTLCFPDWTGTIKCTQKEWTIPWDPTPPQKKTHYLTKTNSQCYGNLRKQNLTINSSAFMCKKLTNI